MPLPRRRSRGEALGTFALVFVGAGAIMVASKSGAFGQLGIALAFGLVITTMIYAVGHISGAHLNPPSPSPSRSAAISPGAASAPTGRPSASARSPRPLLLRASLGDLADLGATQPSGSDAQASSGRSS